MARQPIDDEDDDSALMPCCAHCRAVEADGKPIELYQLGHKWLCEACLDDELLWQKSEADH
jgi:hypothetical protein